MSCCSLYFLKSEKDLFLLFWKKFEKEIDYFKNVFIKNSEENIILSFQFNQKNYVDTLDKMRVWLADSIVVYYKTKYLEKHLKIPRLNAVSFEAVCKALAIFDKITDVEYVLDNLKLSNELNVNSFYVFKLGELRLRWQEICNLFYSSLPELIASDAFLDLMRYLLSITEPGVQNVFISLKGGKIHFKDEKGVALIEPIQKKEDYKSKVILELISLAPKNIYISPEISLKEVAESLRQLFNDKVVYCT